MNLKKYYAVPVLSAGHIIELISTNLIYNAGMNRSRLHQLTLYLAMISILLIPLRSLAFVSDTGTSTGTHEDMPCHGQAAGNQHGVSADLVERDSGQDCCDEAGINHECAQCFITLPMHTVDVGADLSLNHQQPTTNPDILKPVPQSHLYKPPRL